MALALRSTQRVTQPRTVRRISGLAHAGLSASLELKTGRKISAQVVDFNSSGISLGFSNQAHFESVRTHGVKQLSVKMGNVMVGEIDHPEKVRENPQRKTIAFLTGSLYRNSSKREAFRTLVNPLVAPIAVATHPLRIREKIHLKLIEFSARGFRFETSLSNKFLMPGSRLHHTEVAFPCIGTWSCDLKIRHVTVRDQMLEVGCSASNLSPEFRVALGQFALFGSQDSRSLSERIDHLRRSGFALKVLGDAIRIRTVETMEEYDQVLGLRHLAYSHVGKVLPGATSTQMGDLADDRSTILVATLGGAIVGTVRIVKSTCPEEPFPFEELMPMPSPLEPRRGTMFEISKLAVLPELQGTDLVLRLFQAAARETVIEGSHAVCLATRALQRHYKRLGASVISREVPHPVLPNEFLSLLLFKKSAFTKGRGMAGLGWERVGRSVMEELAHFGFSKRHDLLPGKWAQARAESFLIRIQRALMKFLGKARGN